MYTKRLYVVECLDKYEMVCCDEDVGACLDECVLECLYKNNKDIFNGYFLFPHPLE